MKKSPWFTKNCQISVNFKNSLVTGRNNCNMSIGQGKIRYDEKIRGKLTNAPSRSKLLEKT